MNAANKLDFDQRRRACEIEESIDIDRLYDVAAQLILLSDALDPSSLEDIANELKEFHHSARADSLRVIARRQREVLGTLHPSEVEAFFNPDGDGDPRLD